MGENLCLVHSIQNKYDPPQDNPTQPTPHITFLSCHPNQPVPTFLAFITLPLPHADSRIMIHRACNSSLPHAPTYSYPSQSQIFLLSLIWIYILLIWLCQCIWKGQGNTTCDKPGKPCCSGEKQQWFFETWLILLEVRSIGGKCDGGVNKIWNESLRGWNIVAWWWSGCWYALFITLALACSMAPPASWILTTVTFKWWRATQSAAWWASSCISPQQWLSWYSTINVYCDVLLGIVFETHGWKFMFSP